MLKHLILHTVLLLFTINCFSQGAKISFEKKEFNIGTIKEENGQLQLKLRFSNTGKTPLLIRNVKGSCGCTVPKWPVRPILPGRRGQIDITVDPKNRKGMLNKSITIISNTRPAVNVISIKGKILPRPKTVVDYYPWNMDGLRFKKEHLPLMNIKHTSKISLFAEFINNSKKNIVVKRIDKIAHISTKFSAGTVAPNKKGKLYINFDAQKKNDWGFTIDTLKFSINGIQKPEYQLIVSSTIVENFAVMTEEQKKNAPKLVANHTTFDFKNSTKGKIINDKLVFENKGKSVLHIRKIVSRCRDISIKYNKLEVKPGEKLTFNISYNPKKRLGLQNKSITFITNDPKRSIVKYKLSGVIKNTKQ